MKCNIGTSDKIIRFIIGMVIGTFGSMIGSWWTLAGFVPILSATICWCPAYLAFGFSTTREKQN